MTDDLFVLETLEPVAGARRYVCWDDTLDRQTWLWRIDADASVTERIARWATLDHPRVAVVHARGETPSGAFVTTQHPGAQTLAKWRESASATAKTRALVDVVDGLLALAEVRLAAAPTEVFVDVHDRPLLAAVRLDRDGGPDDALESARWIAPMLDLPSADADAIEQAVSLDELRAVCDRLTLRLESASGRWPRWAIGLSIAAIVGAVVGLVGSTPHEPPPDPCRDSAQAAEDWRAAASTIDEPAGAGLERWLDDWSAVATTNCRDGVTKEASAAMVAARRQCLDEHLAALRGVWAAYAEHDCATSACPGPLELLPPANACAWGHQERYLHRPWQQRPVPLPTVERIARWRAVVALGESPQPTTVLTEPEIAQTAPRWRAWIHDARARAAHDDRSWQRASWASLAASIEAGDELGALRAAVSRANGASSRELSLKPPADALARTLAERVTSSYGGSARVQTWVDDTLARLDAAMP